MRENLGQIESKGLSLDYELRELDGPAESATLSAEELVRRLKDEFDAEELADTSEECH